MFVINLAICDFFMMAKTPIFIYNSFTKGFTLGNLGCQIFGFVGSLTGKLNGGRFALYGTFFNATCLSISFPGIGAGATNALIAYDRYALMGVSV